jgi:hypothetical protein
MARMALDVLVYSESAEERMAFIGGRKVVEGQTLDGGILVEAITRDGVILSRGEERLLLQPRLNPYTTPRP